MYGHGQETGHGFERRSSSQGGFARTARILRVVHALREKVPGEAINDMVELLRAMGLVSGDDVELVKKIVRIVDEGMERGLSPDDQVIILYSLAKSLGVTDEEMEDEMLRLAIKKLGVKPGG